MPASPKRGLGREKSIGLEDVFGAKYFGKDFNKQQKTYNSREAQSLSGFGTENDDDASGWETSDTTGDRSVATTRSQSRKLRARNGSRSSRRRNISSSSKSNFHKSHDNDGLKSFLSYDFNSEKEDDELLLDVAASVPARKEMGEDAHRKKSSKRTEKTKEQEHCEKERKLHERHPVKKSTRQKTKISSQPEITQTERGSSPRKQSPNAETSDARSPSKKDHHRKRTEEKPQRPILALKEPSLTKLDIEQSPRSLTEADASFVENASRESHATSDDDSDDDTVLQFDPTQDDNLYRVRQITMDSADYKIENNDGTTFEGKIGLLDDPLSGVHSVHQANGKSLPIFSFLDNSSSPKRSKKPITSIPFDNQEAQLRHSHKLATNGVDYPSGREEAEPRRRVQKSRSNYVEHHQKNDNRGAVARSKSTSEGHKKDHDRNKTSRKHLESEGKSKSKNKNTPKEEFHGENAFADDNTNRMIRRSNSFVQFNAVTASTELKEFALENFLSDEDEPNFFDKNDDFNAPSIGELDPPSVGELNPPSLGEGELDPPSIGEIQMDPSVIDENQESKPRRKIKKTKPKQKVSRKDDENVEKDIDVHTKESFRQRQKRRDAKSRKESLPKSKQHEIQYDTDCGGSIATDIDSAPPGKLNELYPPPNQRNDSFLAMAQEAVATPWDGTDTELSPKKKAQNRGGLATSIGKYFARGRRNSPTNDAEQSDCEASIGSRSFRFRVKRHQLLGDDDSMDSAGRPF